jgi:hypothetical protein
MPMRRRRFTPLHGGIAARAGPAILFRNRTLLPLFGDAAIAPDGD